MTIKEAAAAARKRRFEQRRKPFYAVCLTCNYDCEMITDNGESKFRWENCPRHEKVEKVV